MSAFRIIRPPTAFSLDRDRKSRIARRHEQSHLAFVRKLPCTVCSSRRDVEAAHVRYADPSYGKTTTGMATKPDDKWSVPLCVTHHRVGLASQHANNEQSWWQGHGIDPLAVALKLHCVSGDELAAEAVLSAVRQPIAAQYGRTEP